MSEAVKLIIEDDQGKRSVVPIELGDVSVGRLDGNTIRLNERNVSRHHARIGRENGHIVAEDLDSYNGIFINGDRVAGRQRLHEGDLLRIGDFHLEVRGEGLERRTDETTQKTLSPDLDATQPEIRVEEAEKERSRSRSVDDTEPEDSSEPRAEATAIIRMDHLAEVEESRRSNRSISGDRPRLFCVSTDYAGQQFEIDKTEVVLGRTEDNDIQIDHRSVSRNHAKIVFADRAYKIVDMGSANGTLVNGEQYAQLGLKAGDLIELGHVKFRFVPPGHRFEPTSEESAAMGSVTPRRPPTPLPSPPASRYSQPSENQLAAIIRANPIGAAAVATLMFLGSVLLLWILFGGSDTRPLPVAPQAGLNAPGNRPAALSPADEYVAKARQYMLRREWDKASTRLQLALEEDPGHREALELVRQVQQEIRVQASYDAANRAIREENWADAWRLLNEIPETSVYNGDVAPIRAHVRGALVSEDINRGHRALELSNLGDARAALQRARSLDSEAPGLSGLSDAIDARSRTASNPPPVSAQRPPRAKPTVPKVKPGARPNNRKPPIVRDPPPRVVPDNTPPPPKKDARALYMEGRDALNGGETKRAIELLSKCVQVDRTNCVCYRGMGIAYARSGNGPKAARYYKLYLKFCPDAKDAAQVKKLLSAYGG